MWLKVVIVVLFVGLVISLFSGLFFLIQDQGKTMRTWQSLSVRLVIAVLLMSFIVYGFYTGQLGSKALGISAMDKMRHASNKQLKAP